MRAAVLYGKEDVRVEEVALPALREGAVRVRIGAALTCGTDLKVFKRGYHAKMIVPPALFGHELSGTITELGGGVSDWRMGDRVVVANSAPCGSCYYCGQNQENLCDDLLFLNGAYAEEIIIPQRIVQRNMLRLADATSFKDAALTEPLACVVQGVDDLGPRGGEHALVIGSGPIGLMFVVLLKQAGCRVTVAGRGEERLVAAQHLKADEVIDIAGQTEWLKHVRGRISRTPDLVVEAVGKPETWEAAVQLVRKGGRVNFFGGCPSGTSVSLDTGLLHYSNLILLASFHHSPRTIRKSLALVERGVIQASDFVGGQCALSALPELLKGMTRGNRAVKTLIDVTR
jgi:L-iditol 2-dehydrogenase